MRSPVLPSGSSPEVFMAALTPLLLLAGALVVDIGGGASHSSLVARELGLPAVVNTVNGSRILRDGMLVEVDGTAGTVKIIEG